MRNWLKTILFVSAFSPTLLVLAGVRCYSRGDVDSLVVQLTVISALGTLLPLLILALVKREAEILKFVAKKVESADYFLLVFIGSYAAPVIMKIAEVDFFLTTLIIVVIFLVAWVISNIPSHPILYLIKFRFYKVESSDGMVYILITSENIRSPRDISYVKKISNGMLME
ncbi:hypothetical protein [Methylomicrobium lacus]|uniref:hypothetical protein n=1 Tax=Methylomicrobium lacus TaxID=136992 RepID=UPI00045E870C|nr:hypothetical protein [Methylomicrobium lacus]